MSWYCEYCLTTLKIEHKASHCETKKHKFQARLAKYCALYDKLIELLYEDKRLYNLSEEECDDREIHILKEVDQMLISGVFDNQPDGIEFI